jgi:GNAT superfamily N-acetyltransferase
MPVERLDGPRTMAISDRVFDLYRRCYTRPPWSETPHQLAEYPAKLAAATRRPGFTAMTIIDDERPVGLSYGWPTLDPRNGDRMEKAVVAAFGAARAEALIGGAFAVAELFVDPDVQGRGIGRRLLEGMVRDKDAAWLVTHPPAPAARLYRKLGWKEQGPLPAASHRLPLSLFTLTGNTVAT